MAKLLAIFIGMGVASAFALAAPSYADDHLFQATAAEQTANARTHRGFDAPPASEAGAEAPGRGSPFTAFKDEDLGKPSVGVDKLNPKAQENVPFGKK